MTIGRLLCLHVLLVAMLHGTPAAAADDTAPRRFVLPGHGFLELKVPRKWLDIVRQPTDQSPPTIVFAPRSGLQFEMSVTPAWQVDSAEGASREKALRQQVEA